MKIKDAVVVIFFILVLILVIYLTTNSSSFISEPTSTSEPVIINNNQENNMALSIKSSAFGNNENIPSQYTCDGKGISPPLSFEAVDPSAISLALILDDPDASGAPGGVFDHWVKFNINPSVLIVPEGKEPPGISGKNGAGGLTYTGPCPPTGTHHYHFKLYSLDTGLTLPEGATKSEVEAAMQGHILQQAELIGLYQKIK